MAKLLIATIALLTLVACSRQPPAQGVATWDQMAAIVDRWILKNDAHSALAHTELSGVPRDKIKTVRAVFETWKGISPDLKLVSTEVLSLAEYERKEQEEEQKKPEFFRQNPFPATQWSVTPEKIIVYRFHRDAALKKASYDVKLTVGVFQRNGQWFISACY